MTFSIARFALLQLLVLLTISLGFFTAPAGSLFSWHVLGWLLFALGLDVILAGHLLLRVS